MRACRPAIRVCGAGIGVCFPAITPCRAAMCFCNAAGRAWCARKRACRSEAVIWMAGREDSTAMEDVAQGGWVRSERKPGRYAPMQNGLNARNHGFDLPAHRMYVVVGKSRKVGYDA